MNFQAKIIVTLLAVFFAGVSKVHCQVVGAERVAAATKTSIVPTIDGVVDEDVWSQAIPFSDFFQRVPNPGMPCSEKSEVFVLYDNTALYIGARLKDKFPDSIMTQLTQRDQEGQADHFGILLDTYNDGINAFCFFVTASGVQQDARYSAYGFDYEWNAVWHSAVKLTDDGWSAELKIPFSALRIPKTEQQSWGINLERGIRRHRERSHWATIHPQVDGFVNQFGRLEGVSEIDPPLRLSITPYVSGYLEHNSGVAPTENPLSTSFNGGLDLKYGINEAYTLDFTLIPDFGQVQSDNLVLNLSPFEIQFNEFRQFFKEGIELFSKGNLFYTRRVGASPLLYSSVPGLLQPGDSLIDNPVATQLLNATKLSGRGKKGTGFGIFNASSKESFAMVVDSTGLERRILTAPFTNYNVLVVDQNLRNNSYVTLINTNVWRQGTFYEANVTATEFYLAEKQQKYAASGGAAVSQLYFPDSIDLGHSYNMALSKIRGNIRYGLSHSAKSDKFNPNDLGLLFRNNERQTVLSLNFNKFEPFGNFLKFFSNANIICRQRFDPSVFTDLIISGGAGSATRSFLHFGMDVDIIPTESFDYFEPRTPGRYFVIPANVSFGLWVSSNYANKFAYDVRVGQRNYMGTPRSNYNLSVSPRYRFNDKLSVIYDWSYLHQLANQGFVSFDADSIIFGERNINTMENIVRLQYSFTSIMNLSIRLRHYWSVAEYTDYLRLSENGELLPTSYNRGHDVNFNAFNIDLVYTWVFAPGSEIRVVWKNAILSALADTSPTYFSNLGSTLQEPQTNSFSIKLLYYIDYLSLKRKS